MDTTAPAPLSSRLSPFLERALGELRGIRADAAALTDGLSAAQLAWSPEPGRWSIAEVMAHLNLAGRVYLDALAPALADARARGLADRGDYKPTLAGRTMTWALSPDQRVKLKAPKIFRRAEGAAAVDGPRELAAWSDLHAEMEARLREAAG
ncbi:MAG TPA: DinB family protein, partial [Longimicrobiaceae bacterium]|nr:DinB family protein [Longimicrobiaceae bacterium]